MHEHRGVFLLLFLMIVMIGLGILGWVLIRIQLGW